MEHQTKTSGEPVTQGEQKPSKQKRLLSPAWRWALGAMATIALSFCFAQGYAWFVADGWDAFFIGTLAFLLLCGAISGLLTLLKMAFEKMPTKTFFCIIACLLVSVLSLTAAIHTNALAVSALVLVFFLHQWIAGQYRKLPWYKKGIRVAAVAVSAFVFIAATWILFIPDPPFIAPPIPLTAEGTTGALKNPSRQGEHAVETLFYASPNQKRNPYPGQTAIDAPTVDASGYIEGWNALRSWRFGLSPEALPLNGQVWMPQGEGPFPLVLMVHGNHNAFDRSDGGYAYLGEMLASRGMVVVSADENFLNTAVFADAFGIVGLKKENSARAIILMEHLRQWAAWNQDQNSAFYQKVDMHRVGLVGHSRGGEGVALASLYSQLGHDPQNGARRFEVPYTIRAVAAIAPVEGQYHPAGLDIQLSGVNYLVLHGANDMDVSTFMGADQYRRVEPGTGNFKAAVYMDKANHGQFNSAWGKNDWAGIMNLILRREQLMPMAQQQLAARVFIGAFMDAALNGQTQYQAFFEDIQLGSDWLPAVEYITDYQPGEAVRITSFGEDVDLNSTALPGVTLGGDGFVNWTEAPLQGKYGEMKNRVLQLTWSDQDEEAVYTVDFEALGEPITVRDDLRVSLASAKTKDGQSLRFSISLVDEAGNRSVLPIDTWGQIPQPLNAPIFKAPVSWVLSSAEPVLQGFTIPLRDFEGLHGRIVRMQWTMDQTAEGTLYADDLGVIRD